MKDYLKHDEWLIIEDSFHPEFQEISESIFSIGNGHMGQRANFEEDYSGTTLQGSYLAGVYYPDKTQVGWWKNGYPEYFAKVINSANWIGIHVTIDGTMLDLATCKVTDFRRVLNMREGYLSRSFVAMMPNGVEVKVEALRFVSMTRPELGAIRYHITLLSSDAAIELTPYLDGDVMNRDSNHGEKFWEEVSRSNSTDHAALTMKTKKLNFYVATAMDVDLYLGNQPTELQPELSDKNQYVAKTLHIKAKQGQTLTLYKYAASVTSRDHAIEDLTTLSEKLVQEAKAVGFDELFAEQQTAWIKKWNNSDIVITGDVAAQQGIRFNIFQLNQTYTGDDERLNIGPKGFTGEKYGGSTYWDTEAYCLPFYLSTSTQQIARNLLIYRYRHLEKAKENARKLGFKQGALYPMVTMNGEECHNEWEITFEEIHRNGAIAYAIFNYVNYTGDLEYLAEYGLEVLVEISRFWAERVNLSKSKNQYVILGVTGPNEYENNVNNNWYTNRMASWTMEYTLEVVQKLQASHPKRWNELHEKLGILSSEMEKWQDIIANMYYPADQENGLFLQQDGFLDKAIAPVSAINPAEMPINQHWSWDRILRSCYIKQADVLQGLFFLGDRYDLETKRRHFDFYEPLTVHESSLSPCVHSILACELGYRDKAYELYLRTSRLDLNDYNNDTEDGCHITSMAGTWMSIVYGFGGFRVQSGRVQLNPFLMAHWEAFSFKIMYREARINVLVKKDTVTITNESDVEVPLTLYQQNYQLKGNEALTVDTLSTSTIR